MARPRLRTVLLLVNVVILVLPLAGLWLLRLYESALIRQTESELLAQGAVLAATFKAERDQLIDRGLVAEAPATLHAAQPLLSRDRPPTANLDLADDPVLPPAPDPVPSASPASPLAAAAGRALAPVLREVQPVTLAALRVVDFRGVVVATTGEDQGTSLAAQDEIGRALQGEVVSVMRWRDRPARVAPTGLSRGGSLRIFVALPVIADDHVVAAVVLSRTPRSLGQAIYGKRIPLLALGALLLAVVSLLAIVASRLITRPLRHVVVEAQRVASGELGSVVPLAGPAVKEIAELTEAVARMAATLERRADYIRSFAAHVSHEFKTPLAGAKGALELLDEHSPTLSEAERRRLLGVAGQSLERLERLVRRLLDLARADMMRPGAAAVALAAVLERLAQRYAVRGLAMTVKSGRERVGLSADAIEIVLTCLLDNVLDHAGAGAAVTVDSAAVADGSVVLTLADDGPGIAESDAARIFEPFFTTAREAGGTGLGLSIARAIVTGAGGSIALVPSPAGARFRLLLPAGGQPPLTA